MKTVSLTNVYQQKHVLSEFQFMVDSPETKTELRKFLSQLREVDFILISRIYYELVMGEKPFLEQIKTSRILNDKKFY
jgi:hypothetical protein